MFVSPISSDCGQSLGAILFHEKNIKCTYPFLGREFGKINTAEYEILIEDLLDKKIIGWFQGRSELGPRALGNRSFIGLPDSLAMKERMSVKVKKREPYRPVACIIPEEKLGEYFEGNYLSPYMTFNYKAKEKAIKQAPAIIHADGTCRVQTLQKDANPYLHELMCRLESRTGCPIIMNSSFNVDGEPIVDSVEDAIKSFKLSSADALYINGKKYGETHA